MYNNWSELVQKVDFIEKCEESKNETYLLEIDEYGGLLENSMMSDEVKKKLLYCDSFISYSVDSKIPCKKNFMIKYNVLERTVDDKNNVFIIAKSETFDLEIKKEYE